MTSQKAREQIVQYGKLLYQKGLTVGTAGNISARGENETMLITPTSTCKGMLEEDKIVTIDIRNGNVLGAGADPPSRPRSTWPSIGPGRRSTRSSTPIRSTAPPWRSRA